jgi:hypothetical protein
MKIEIQVDPSGTSGLTLRHDGREALKLGLLLTLYFDNGHALERRKAVIDCFNDFWMSYGSKLHWAMNSTVNYWYDLSKRSVSPPAGWLAVDSEEGWEFKYHGGARVDSASDLLVQALGSAKWEADMGELGFIKACLPLELLARQPDALLELAFKWCRRLCPIHGYGGIGFLSPAAEFSWQEEYETILHGLAFRLLGVEVDYPLTHSRFLSKGIKGVNWLTVLDTNWLGVAGGIGVVKDIDGVRVHNYGCGVVIQAGERPMYGDVKSGDDLSTYQKLISALKSIRVREHEGVHSLGTDDTMNGANFRRWLARFD